jgi:hypothetical protein
MVGTVLGEFFYAAMQKTDMRSDLGDHFSIQFENEPQNPVSTGVLRSHV